MGWVSAIVGGPDLASPAKEGRLRSAQTKANLLVCVDSKTLEMENVPA